MCPNRYAKSTNAYPGSSGDGLRTADLTDLAADSTTVDVDSTYVKPSCVLVFGTTLEINCSYVFITKFNI